MAMIDHWHPVTTVTRLKRGPVGVKVCGREIAVFRTASGEVAALDDACPHRRMRLSKGIVKGERLQCGYHGWTFDSCGRGESPGTPKLHACAVSYDAREEYGAVWVKPRDVQATFPQFDLKGRHSMGLLEHRIQAPLELVLDNFCEIEHTPTTHAVFGYDLNRMRDVQVRFEPTETTVRVINSGPSKRLPLWQRVLIGVQPGDLFHDDWTTHFSPVYSVYDHWWADPAGGRESRVKWRLYIFFTPVSDTETALTTWAYMSSRYPSASGGTRPFRGVLRRYVDHEIKLDIAMIEGLASHETGIEGLKLSRFDRVLGLNRERIDRVYRGQPAGRLKLVGV